MEDVVDCCEGRQLQLVRHCTNALQDLEGPKEFEWQLVVGAARNGCLNIRL